MSGAIKMLKCAGESCGATGDPSTPDWKPWLCYACREADALYRERREAWDRYAAAAFIAIDAAQDSVGDAARVADSLLRERDNRFAP